jgi:hypothetical protein
MTQTQEMEEKINETLNELEKKGIPMDIGDGVTVPIVLGYENNEFVVVDRYRKATLTRDQAYSALKGLFNHMGYSSIEEIALVIEQDKKIDGETWREKYDRIKENNSNFWETVTKRVGRISYGDWLHYASRFLRTFDSAYNGSSDVEIKTGVYVPVGEVESYMASQGIGPDELQSDLQSAGKAGDLLATHFIKEGANLGTLYFSDVSAEDLRKQGETVFRLQGVKLNGTLDEALRRAVPESLFREVRSIGLRIDPNDETEKFVYAFGHGDFTRRKPRHLSFYAQGSGKLTRALHEEFKPRNLKEAALFRLVDGIGYNLDVFG